MLKKYYKDEIEIHEKYKIINLMRIKENMEM